MAFPTAVNSQITDAVPQTGTAPTSETPAQTPTDQSTPTQDHGAGNGLQEGGEKGNGHNAPADGYGGGNGLVEGGDGAGI